MFDRLKNLMGKIKSPNILVQYAKSKESEGAY